jgi:hypothetical protein
MARFFDAVGYGESVETPPASGVWVDVVTEISYYGDITRKARNLDAGENLNDNINASNSISIVADQYAIEHFSQIKYVRWAGALWTVTGVEVRSPRLIMNLGSVYNGPTPTTPSSVG